MPAASRWDMGYGLARGTRACACTWILAVPRVRASLFSVGGGLSKGATGRAPQRRPDSRRFLLQHFRNYKLNLVRARSFVGVADRSVPPRRRGNHGERRERP